MNIIILFDIFHSFYLSNYIYFPNNWPLGNKINNRERERKELNGKCGRLPNITVKWHVGCENLRLHFSFRVLLLLLCVLHVYVFFLFKFAFYCISSGCENQILQSCKNCVKGYWTIIYDSC